ncbi:MAG: FliM/FliN family flagellar motor C-terminal domain-containing protein, partial [Gammaproteobacteria bacterium]|nr:FliM/FliN family flagellar motor C-terminal domain-containing protein [Gammaproteobacteria bacterium]
IAEVQLTAELAKIKMNLQGVLDLKPGDILPFEMPETIHAMVEDVPFFHATFGEHGDHAALKVTELIEQPQDTTPKYHLNKKKAKKEDQ